MTYLVMIAMFILSFLVEVLIFDTVPSVGIMLLVLLLGMCIVHEIRSNTK